MNKLEIIIRYKSYIGGLIMTYFLIYVAYSCFWFLLSFLIRMLRHSSWSLTIFEAMGVAIPSTVLHVIITYPTI